MSILNSLKYDQWYKKLSASAKKDPKVQKDVIIPDIITKFHNFLVIALVIIRPTHKAHKTDRGAENPTGPKLPDFTLFIIHHYKILGMKSVKEVKNKRCVVQSCWRRECIMA